MKSLFVFLFFVVINLSCSKFVEVDPPTNTIISEQAFSSDNSANSAIAGLYAKLIDQSRDFSFGNSVVTISGGVASDETALFDTDPNIFPIYRNEIFPNTDFVLRLWRRPYEIIYIANACLEQLQGNNKISISVRRQLIGETKFMRAFCYFYLVNFFGDVPFLTTTVYKDNAIAQRTSLEVIYSHIIDDLESSLNDLPENYSLYNYERIRCTKWAAMALLSRLCLYTGNWEKAEFFSGQLIGNSNYELLPDLNNVFLANSKESIFQLFMDGSINSFNVLPEALVTIPYDRTTNPWFYLPASFVNEFESDDKRWVSWIDSTEFMGTIYFIPYKYKTGPAQLVPNSTPSEYYMVLRLAEQYLIRAEARTKRGDLTGAAMDLNKIRERAGLNPKTFTSETEAMDNILLERKKELFYEWAHRWFDLKRTGRINTVMSFATPQKGGVWNETDKLFPIPASEIMLNPKLTQNPGY